MQDVFSKNPKMGDPSSLTAQLDENSRTLDHLQQEIRKYEVRHTKWTHTHLFNGPFSGTTQVSRYQKGKTNLDFTEARDSEWHWHQLGHMQVCTSL